MDVIRYLRMILVILGVLVCLIGCANNKISKSSSIDAQVCDGIEIAGVLQDSLSQQPIPFGWAVFESASPSTNTVLTFSPLLKTRSSSSGSFQLCVPSITMPTLLVIDALDSSGDAYPPLIVPVTRTVNLGVIPMGGCTLTCGIDGQEQSSSSVMITGQITSWPVSEAGVVLPLYSQKALDGTSSVWNMVIPPLSDLQSTTFTTVPSSCTDTSEFCAAYSFKLPSQKPVVLQRGIRSEESGVPVYSINIAPYNPGACAQSNEVTFVQQDGTTPLDGIAGTTLVAKTMNLTGCH